MSGRFDNEVVVVTGAGSRTDRGLGIGTTTARRFAEEGATVVAVDVDEEMAQRTVDIIKEDGGPEATAVVTDVTDDEEVEQLAAVCEERFGRVDTLVNNAGVRINTAPLSELDQEEIDFIIDVNLKGAIHCSRHVVPLIAESGGGTVVNVSSSNAEVGRPGWAPYDSTKAGLLGLTRDMACDHAEQNIRVNAISPGWTITDFHLPEDEDEAEEKLEEWSSPRPDGPGILKRNAHPREQADAILFLASDAASYITGTNLHVDGGIDVVGSSPELDID